MTMLPVNEIFETIQGEARWTGTPSVFVRLQGCPVGCAWCDTKHTWYVKPELAIAPALLFMKNTDSEHHSNMTTHDLMECFDEFSAAHIVITGGEPCLYNLIELTTAIIESGRTCQIETSGTHAIKCHPMTWITVSPKIDMAGGFKVLREAIEMASEIKHPVGKVSDVDKVIEQIMPWVPHHADIWLQPLSQSNRATQLCIEQATKHNFRVSIQTHKYLGVR